MLGYQLWDSTNFRCSSLMKAVIWRDRCADDPYASFIEYWSYVHLFVYLKRLARYHFCYKNWEEATRMVSVVKISDGESPNGRRMAGWGLDRGTEQLEAAMGWCLVRLSSPSGRGSGPCQKQFGFFAWNGAFSRGVCRLDLFFPSLPSRPASSLKFLSCLKLLTGVWVTTPGFLMFQCLCGHFMHEETSCRLCHRLTDMHLVAASSNCWLWVFSTIRQSINDSVQSNSSFVYWLTKFRFKFFVRYACSQFVTFH